MAFDYANQGTGPANQYSGVNLQGQYGTIMKDVQNGRPGALAALYQMLDAMGGVNQGNMQYDQYTQMRPYATDQAQQGRESFQAAYPYLTDPYESNRFNLTKQKELWGMQKPVAQGNYNWQLQNMDNQYINPSYHYGQQY
jgi:hypothetical protein